MKTDRVLIINSISRPNKEHACAVLMHTANTDLSTPKVYINNAETTEFDVSFFTPILCP